MKLIRYLFLILSLCALGIDKIFGASAKDVVLEAAKHVAPAPQDAVQALRNSLEKQLTSSEIAKETTKKAIALQNWLNLLTNKEVIQNATEINSKLKDIAIGKLRTLKPEATEGEIKNLKAVLDEEYTDDWLIKHFELYDKSSISPIVKFNKIYQNMYDMVQYSTFFTENELKAAQIHLDYFKKSNLVNSSKLINEAQIEKATEEAFEHLTKNPKFKLYPLDLAYVRGKMKQDLAEIFYKLNETHNANAPERLSRAANDMVNDIYKALQTKPANGPTEIENAAPEVTSQNARQKLSTEDKVFAGSLAVTAIGLIATVGSVLGTADENSNNIEIEN